MDIKLVVFDITSTTMHDDGGVDACLSDVLAATGVAVTRETVSAVIDEPTPAAIAQLLASATGRPASEALASSVYRAFERLLVGHFQWSPRVRPVVGAEEAFRALKSAGVRVALDSPFNRAIVDSIIGRLDWHDLIDVTVSGDEIDRARPSPDLVGRAMLLASVVSSQCVAKVAGTTGDLQAARSAGCGKVIALGPKLRRRVALEAAAHIDVADDVADVLSLCLGQAAC